MDLQEIRKNMEYAKFSKINWSQIPPELLKNVSRSLDLSEWNVLHNTTWRIVLVTVCVCVIVFGFIANLSIATIIGKNKHLHTPTNIFIMTLCLSDITMCIFNLPVQLYYQLTDEWIFGKIMCHIIMGTFAVPVFVSTLSIQMIAIDRFILIVFPFKKRMSNKIALVLVCAIIVFTFGMAIPLVLHMRMDVLNNILQQVRCVESWTGKKIQPIYTVCVFIIQFFMPLLASSILYLFIYFVLKTKRRTLKKHESHRNNRTNKILVSIVLLFTVCWLPWNLFGLISNLRQSQVQVSLGKYYVAIELILRVFAMSSACVNPFLYGYLNDNFRKEFANLFKRQSNRKHFRLNGCTQGETSVVKASEYIHVRQSDKQTGLSEAI